MNLNHCAELFSPFQGGRLFVGFSGGADSTVALLVTRLFQKTFNYHLTAIHFDHGLRGEESTHEAEVARKFAQERGIDFELIQLELTPGSNLESRARVARLRAWRELIGTDSKSAVILGHHAGDRMENLLLRLTRGSNATGLTSMRRYSQVDGITFLRPLLDFDRSSIETFLHDNGIHSWSMDSSNGSNYYRRNIIRNKLLPELYSSLPGAESGILRTIDTLEQDANFLEGEARRHFLELDGTAEFWKSLHPALLVRVLRLWLQQELGYDLIPPAPLVRRLHNELIVNATEPRLIPVCKGILLILANGKLRLAGNTSTTAPQSWNFLEKKAIQFSDFWLNAEFLEEYPGTIPDCSSALFDADQLPDILIVRERLPGDLLVPFGKKLPVSLKKLRTDRKIPSSLQCPVITTPDGKIIWAPLIRHSAHAPVVANTSHILRLTLNQT